MNVAVSIKESQLLGVLEVLGKTGHALDIQINIKDGELEKKLPGLTTENLYQLQEEIHKKREEENKEEQNKEEEDKEEEDKEEEDKDEETEEQEVSEAREW